MTGSNRRPPPCKGGALPAELITHFLEHITSISHGGTRTESWWVMTGSNRRPPPCKGGALPAELITPAVWSRIIGNRRNESTIFPVNLRVRIKFSHPGRFCPGFCKKTCRMWTGVEDSPPSGRLFPTFYYGPETPFRLLALRNEGNVANEN